ncbi:DUF3455 domain-containing protein [Undibacterium macrobrachii]|uniref:DUF3455 domain-containing protein n=1 Tax=Undibacterium macrobrachii TaxID=1119058 RepID=A0ABQ2XE86_9BURK|nr:DUF3455 domain-containing protein [Undibacterium macrobrachii]GGX12371.1 hypothetical protein GCM10011282_18020 [Undibacterium macrobrachii]
MKRTTQILPIATAACLLISLSACSATLIAPNTPPAITVPSGNQLVMVAVGSGDLNYECRVKANSNVTYEWVFTGPNALLSDKNGMVVGRYYGGPTWESNDGSKISGKQIATAPASPTAIPLQLVKVDTLLDGTNSGMLTGITYIQRLNTVGGIAPTESCSIDNLGAKVLVKYQADYLFYKAN